MGRLAVCPIFLFYVKLNVKIGYQISYIFIFFAIEIKYYYISGYILVESYR